MTNPLGSHLKPLELRETGALSNDGHIYDPGRTVIISVFRQMFNTSPPSLNNYMRHKHQKLVNHTSGGE